MKFLAYIIYYFYFNQGVVGQNYLSYVCNSYSDYWVTRDSSPNCYYSSDVFNSFEKIAWSHGYMAHGYEVITEDSYILKVFRIFPKGKTPDGPPILLQHGTGLSSTSYMLLGNHSLAFILANNGYDVWLGNFRGTTYSSRHKFLKPGDKKYWNFSFHEHGLYDVKSFIDLVTSQSKQKVIYIGYSLGTRAYNVYNSLHPKEAMEKIRVSISLASTAFMYYNKSPLLKLAKLVPNGIVQKILGALFPNGVIGHKTLQSTKMFLHLCLDSPVMLYLCQLKSSSVWGFNIHSEPPQAYPIMLAQAMEPGSLKSLYHTHQSLRDKEFRQYDYGRKENLKYYGTRIPPIYNLSKIMVPNYIFYGSGDFLATEKATNVIYQKLPKKAKPFGKPYNVEDKKFSHINFIAHKRIKTLVYDHIVKFLREKQNYFNN